MVILYILVLFAIIGFTVFVFPIVKNGNQQVGKEKVHEKLPYTPRWNFMTDSEKAFYKQLEIAVGDKYYIVPQVQLSSILYVPRQTPNYRGHLSKIDKKSVDFALFTKPDFKFFKAIELNDYTHDRKSRIERDAFVKRAMLSAGLTLDVVDHRQSFKG